MESGTKISLSTVTVTEQASACPEAKTFDFPNYFPFRKRQILNKTYYLKISMCQNTGCIVE